QMGERRRRYANEERASHAWSIRKSAKGKKGPPAVSRRATTASELERAAAAPIRGRGDAGRTGNALHLEAGFELLDGERRGVSFGNVARIHRCTPSMSTG